MPKYRNPHFEQTQMNIPAWIGAIAPSGTGKTQWLLNYINKCQDTFGHIIVVYKATEPLHEFLRDKVGFLYKIDWIAISCRFKYGK